MAAAGGASSIITQVQQTGGPPINTLGGTIISGKQSDLRQLTLILHLDIGGDEHITLDLR